MDALGNQLRPTFQHTRNKGELEELINSGFKEQRKERNNKIKKTLQLSTIPLLLLGPKNFLYLLKNPETVDNYLKKHQKNPIINIIKNYQGPIACKTSSEVDKTIYGATAKTTSNATSGTVKYNVSGIQAIDALGEKVTLGDLASNNGTTAEGTIIIDSPDYIPERFRETYTQNSNFNETVMNDTIEYRGGVFQQAVSGADNTGFLGILPPGTYIMKVSSVDQNGQNNAPTTAQINAVKNELQGIQEGGNNYKFQYDTNPEPLTNAANQVPGCIWLMVGSSGVYNSTYPETGDIAGFVVLGAKTYPAIAWGGETNDGFMRGEQNSIRSKEINWLASHYGQLKYFPEFVEKN